MLNSARAKPKLDLAARAATSALALLIAILPLGAWAGYGSTSYGGIGNPMGTGSGSGGGPFIQLNGGNTPTTGDINIGYRLNFPTLINNVGLQLPTNAGDCSLLVITGVQEGDTCWDTTNDVLYVYDGASFVAVGFATGPYLLLDTSNDPLTGDLVTGTLVAPHDNTIHGGFPNGSGRENDPAFNVEGFVDINGQYSDPAAVKPLLEITSNQVFTDSAYSYVRMTGSLSGAANPFMELLHTATFTMPTLTDTENVTYKASINLQANGVDSGVAQVHSVSGFEVQVVSPFATGLCFPGGTDLCYYYGMSTPSAEIGGGTGYILKDTFHNVSTNNIGVLDHLFRFGTREGEVFDATDHLVDFSTGNVDVAYVTADGGAYFQGPVHVVGKLTVDGAIDPPSLSLSGGTALYIESADGSTATAAGIGSNKGRLRYLNGTGWQSSANDGVWSTLATGSGSAFVQNGNSFGALATLGTNDAFGISLETNNTSRLNILSTGEIIAGGPTVTAFTAGTTLFSVVQPTAGSPALFGARAAGAPSVFFGASSEGTVTAPTASSPGAPLFILAATGYGSDNLVEPDGAAYIGFFVDGAPAASSVGGSIVLSTKTAADALPLPRLYVMGSGFVGVNVNTPVASEIFGVSGDAYISGKLTVAGVIDPTALILSGGTDLYLESADGSTAAVAPANHGRIRYLDGTGWQVSSNGGAYTTLSTGGGTVTGTGTAGQAAFWTGASAIGGSTQFLWDNTTGLAVTGAPVNLNSSSNFAVNIGTGTTTATVSVGGGSNNVAVNSSTWDISAAGAASGLTGISSSGTIIFSGLTASRALFTDGSSNLATSGASAALLSSLTDETGSGLAVFGTSPTITTSLVTGSASFDLFNTTATTVNAFGAATTVNVGAANMLMTLQDNAAVGLGSGAGRFEFDDLTVDEINVLAALFIVSSYSSISTSSTITNTGFPVNSVEEGSANGGFAAWTFSNTANQRAIFALERARGTAASPSALSAGDLIGDVVFNGYTDARRQAARILVTAATGWGATGTDSPGQIELQTTPDGPGQPDSLTRIFISSGGTVGVGTDSTPDTLLDVQGSFSAGTNGEMSVATNGNTTVQDLAIDGGDVSSTAGAINFLGGSGSTGCTMTDSNGNLACSGDISVTASNSQFVAQVNSQSAPGYSFTGDLDTGIYYIAANNFGISAGNTEVMTFTSSLIEAKKAIQIDNGTIQTDGALTTLNMLNTANLTTVNAFQSATTINIGASAGTTSLAGDLSIDGQDITSTGADVRFTKPAKMARYEADPPAPPTCDATYEADVIYVQDTNPATNTGGLCVCIDTGSGVYAWTAGVPAPSTGCP